MSKRTGRRVAGEPWGVTGRRPTPAYPSRRGRLSSSRGGARSAKELHPLDQASIAFVGAPSRERIAELLDPVLERLGHDRTAETYSRAASVLIALRKDAAGHGVTLTELAILERMARTPRWPAWCRFKIAAAATARAFEIEAAPAVDPEAVDPMPPTDS